MPSFALTAFHLFGFLAFFIPRTARSIPASRESANSVCSITSSRRASSPSGLSFDCSVRDRAIQVLKVGQVVALATSSNPDGSCSTIGTIPYHTIIGRLWSPLSSALPANTRANLPREETGKRWSEEASASRTNPESSFFAIAKKISRSFGFSRGGDFSIGPKRESIGDLSVNKRIDHVRICSFGSFKKSSGFANPNMCRPHIARSRIEAISFLSLKIFSQTWMVFLWWVSLRSASAPNHWRANHAFEWRRIPSGSSAAFSRTERSATGFCWW